MNRTCFLYYLDYLRVFLTMLVILSSVSAVAFGASGGCALYIEGNNYRPNSSDCSQHHMGIDQLIL